jgi:hypothetical protein
MLNVTVRPAKPNDIPALAQLWLEKMVLVAQSDSRFKLLPDAADQWATQAVLWFSDERCMIYAAEQENHLTGFVMGWIQTAPLGVALERIGLITELALDMHQYQQGLARTLLTPLREWFNHQGVGAVAAIVPHRHPVQQAFWRSLGATEWVDFMWIK